MLVLSLPVLQYYKLTNSHQQISSYVFDVVRATVPKMNLDDVFTVSRYAWALGRAEHAARTELHRKLPAMAGVSTTVCGVLELCCSCCLAGWTSNCDCNSFSRAICVACAPVGEARHRLLNQGGMARVLGALQCL